MIVIILVIIFVAYTCMRKKKTQPPLASGAWPVVGHTMKFVKCPEELYKLLLSYSMESVRNDEALTFRIFDNDVYGLSNPDDAFTVLNSCLQKDIIYDYFKPWIGEGLFAAKESTWRRHRTLLSPTFSQGVMDSYLPELNQQAKSLVSKLNDKAGKGKFCHNPYLEHASLQSICSTAMGVVMDDKDVELREQYFQARAKFYLGILMRAQKVWLQSEFAYKVCGLKKIQDDLGKTLRGLTDSIIKKRRNELIQNKVGGEKRVKPFMEHLLDMEKRCMFTSTEIQEEVDTFVVTGSETVAVTLIIALIVTGTYPEVQKNIFEELRQVFRGSLRDVEKRDLLQLKYLEAVIKETWRLYPVVPIVGRTLDKDVKIRNYVLPSGSRCFVSLYGVNRHPSWGPDVEQFRPERWLNRDSPVNHFATFGFGKRRCIGANYAVMAVKTMLSHVLRHYVVTGDVAELVCKWSVLARPLPKDYISIQRRSDFVH